MYAKALLNHLLPFVVELNFQSVERTFNVPLIDLLIKFKTGHI